jgi:hypothetical protein
MQTRRVAYDDVCDARATDWPTLNDAALALAHQPAAQHRRTWALFVLWCRHGETGSRPRRDKLDHVLRSSGLGGYRLICHFHRRGAPDTVAASARFVYGITKKSIERLVRKHDPDVAIFGDENDCMHLVRPGYGRAVGRYHPGLVAQLCSEARDSQLVCLGFDATPQSWFQALHDAAARRQRNASSLPHDPDALISVATCRTGV